MLSVKAFMSCTSVWVRKRSKARPDRPVTSGVTVDSQRTMGPPAFDPHERSNDRPGDVAKTDHHAKPREVMGQRPS